MIAFMQHKQASPVIWNVAGGLLLVLQLMFQQVQAAQIPVMPGDGTLQKAINTANSGDTLLLGNGVYKGSIIVNKTLQITGTHGSVIDGENSGHVITVFAPHVLIKGLRIMFSGSTLETEDSGVFITEHGDHARIESNIFQDNLIGVYLKGPDSAVVSQNVITGSQNHRINDRGNGVYLWNSPGSVIEHNRIQYGRDGIYVTNSKHNTFHGNLMRDLRFAVHYMYTHDSEVSNNISINNHVGYALMFSDRIIARENQSIDDHQRGLFFNFANYSIVEGNRVTGGPEKCVFIYNANFNQINNNAFENCDIGIHFTAGSARNQIYENAFINNKTQVKYVGTRYIEWSKDGRGNYWSDNSAFDMDNNQIADQAYKPNDLVDQIVWRHPMAKLLLNSPSMQILKWAQSEFPGLHPGGVTDSSPLMGPPEQNFSPSEILNMERLPNG